MEAEPRQTKAAEEEEARQLERREKAERLKLILREKNEPFFSDEEIVFMLQEADWDIRKAAYAGFLRKAEDDSLRMPSGLSAPSGRKYWLALAGKYRRNRGGEIKAGNR